MHANLTIPVESVKPASTPVVAARLSCRYSNGLSVSLTARLIRVDGVTLVVHCNEELIKGTNMKASGGEFSCPEMYRVARCSRLENIPGRYEVELLRVSRIRVVNPRRKLPALLRHAALRLVHELSLSDANGKPLGSTLNVSGAAADGTAKALAMALTLILQRKKLIHGRTLRRRLRVRHE